MSSSWASICSFQGKARDVFFGRRPRPRRDGKAMSRRGWVNQREKMKGMGVWHRALLALVNSGYLWGVTNNTSWLVV